MTNEELILEFQNGNEKAFDTLINQNQGLIKYAIGKYGFLSINTYEDVYSECLVAVWKIASKYRPSEQYTLTTYILNAIKWHLCRVYKTSDYYRQAKCNITFISIDNSLNDDTEDTYKDTIADDVFIEDDCIEKCLLDDAKKKIWTAVNSLSERASEIIHLHYQSNMPYEELAEVFNVSVSRIGQILNNAMIQLKMNDLIKEAAYNLNICKSIEPNYYQNGLRSFRNNGSPVELAVMASIEQAQRIEAKIALLRAKGYG